MRLTVRIIVCDAGKAGRFGWKEEDELDESQHKKNMLWWKSETKTRTGESKRCLPYETAAVFYRLLHERGQKAALDRHDNVLLARIMLFLFWNRELWRSEAELEQTLQNLTEDLQKHERTLRGSVSKVFTTFAPARYESTNNLKPITRTLNPALTLTTE